MAVARVVFMILIYCALQYLCLFQKKKPAPEKKKTNLELFKEELKV